MATSRKALIDAGGVVRNIILIDDEQHYEPPEGLSLRDEEPGDEIVADAPPT